MGATIVASSPGDIVIEFKVSDASGGTAGGKETSFEIPVKTLTINKTMDVTPEYGIGSHQAYAHVVGKIAYEGDFTIGTWWVSDEANPSSWDHLVRDLLTFPNDQGLPREFTINIYARGGEAMQRQGTGTYGVSGTMSEAAEGFLGENITAQSSNADSMIIETLNRCLLKGDGLDIPEVGGTVSRKYPYVCFRRTPL